LRHDIERLGGYSFAGNDKSPGGRDMDNAAVAAFWEANAAEWTRQSRAGFDVYRDALNTPAFFAMLPPIEGLHGLDIGCGEGQIRGRSLRAGQG
jgi:hypothetical protein